MAPLWVPLRPGTRGAAFLEVASSYRPASVCISARRFGAICTEIIPQPAPRLLSGGGSKQDSRNRFEAYTRFFRKRGLGRLTEGLTPVENSPTIAGELIRNTRFIIGA